VSREAFRAFVPTLEAKPININDRTFPGLSQLAAEFGFRALFGKLADRGRLRGLVALPAAECLSRISTLEERAGKHEHPRCRFETDLADFSSALNAVPDAKDSEVAATHRSKLQKSPRRCLKRLLLLWRGSRNGFTDCGSPLAEVDGVVLKSNLSSYVSRATRLDTSVEEKEN
jgi:hypothetical protein